MEVLTRPGTAECTWNEIASLGAKDERSKRVAPRVPTASFARENATRTGLMSLHQRCVALEDKVGSTASVVRTDTLRRMEDYAVTAQDVPPAAFGPLINELEAFRGAAENRLQQLQRFVQVADVLKRLHTIELAAARAARCSDYLESLEPPQFAAHSSMSTSETTAALNELEKRIAVMEARVTAQWEKFDALHQGYAKRLS
jgi:BMFP domain-containing protein YqiC